MYKQHDGYDKFRVRDDDGHTKTSGKATYNEDGSLQRLDLIHPRGNGIHDHEVIKQLEDGDYWHRYFPDHPDHKKADLHQQLPLDCPYSEPRSCKR